MADQQRGALTSPVFLGVVFLVIALLLFFYPGEDDKDVNWIPSSLQIDQFSNWLDSALRGNNITTGNLADRLTNKVQSMLGPENCELHLSILLHEYLADETREIDEDRSWDLDRIQKAKADEAIFADGELKESFIVAYQAVVSDDAKGALREISRDLREAHDIISRSGTRDEILGYVTLVLGIGSLLLAAVKYGQSR
jgi:hypothetical protein